jgi:MFS family permease
MTQATRYRRYLLAVLMTISAFNSVDRLALGLLLQNIKVDLALTDTELGLLSGIAFTFFYSLMGIPIARWADRGNRVLITTVTTLLWSVMVALCGTATSFLQFLLFRAATAVGEAGCSPPAFSLIADYFTQGERPRAIAIYLLGGCVSVVIGYFVAGWLNQFYGWRMTFVLLGLPGIVPAILAWLTLREPRRKAKLTTDSHAAPGSTDVLATGHESSIEPDIKTVLTTLWANRTFRHVLFAYSVGAFFYSGILQWQPAFFIRSYGLSTGELGTWLALIYGLGGMVGMYLGGEWASRAAIRNERLQLKVFAIGNLGVGAVSVLVYLSPNRYWAFGLMATATVAGATVSAPMFAIILALVPERMRATAVSIVFLTSNLIGVGLGPLVAGALSDELRQWFGTESLRFTLLALCPGYILVAWQTWRASMTVTADLMAIQVEHREQRSLVPPAQVWH